VSARRIAIQTVLLGLVFFGITALFNAFAIDPGVASYYGMDEDTLRYRIGTWINDQGDLIAIPVCWPVAIAHALDISYHGPVPFIFGCVLAAFGWVLLWHLVIHWRQRGKSPS
jgi:hypothetical protein